MRILIAGASGAIGQPLVRRLRASQHDVFALTQSPDSDLALKEIGAEPVVGNALDAAAVKAAVGRIRPDAVIKVHIDDAAGATAAALECTPGAYNIVDRNPSPQHVWLTAFARAVGAPTPPRVSEEEAVRASGLDAVYYATRLRGASHEKARRELEFRPRPLEWI
jgi:nucleoside-diphosphate-sugar epimerase